VVACACTQVHRPRKVVITGGPGAGKTAVLELIRQATCAHVKVVPESAGIVFGGGFPRGGAPEVRHAAQRAIYYVQRELEIVAAADNYAVLLCDRGTVDGGAYWTSPGELWPAVGTTLAAELARYDAVIHLRTPGADRYHDGNPLRIETAEEAAAIDARIAWVWAAHPRRFEVPASPDFLVKAARAIELVLAELPACCRAGAVTGR
jgi:predicted ATPase